MSLFCLLLILPLQFQIKTHFMLYGMQSVTEHEQHTNLCTTKKQACISTGRAAVYTARLKLLVR